MELSNSAASQRSPRVSLLMAAYNGAAFIGESIASLLAQSFADFELIIIDDASTDGTAKIVAAYADPRIRLLRNTANLGIVGTRNRGFAAARGIFVAILDQDDLSRPRRLEAQVAYLDGHPDCVLVATDIDVMEAGHLRASRFSGLGATGPVVLRWMLHISNPLIHSSVMFRADVVRSLGIYLRQDYALCEDYDFYLRMLPLGEIAILPERLTVLREHGGRASKRQEAALTANAVKLLSTAYAPYLGEAAPAAADLVVRLLAASNPVPDGDTLLRLGHFLGRLMQMFLQESNASPVERAAIEQYTGVLWWRMMRVSVRSGRLPMLFRHRGRIDAARYARPALLDRIVWELIGTIRRLRRDNG